MNLKIPSRRGLTIALPVLLLLSGGGWASYQVFSGPDRDVVTEEPFVIAEAVTGTVEQSLTLNASASWSATDAFASQASGMVTEVMLTAGDRIAAGDVLFTVDLKPVIAAEGDIPSFRPLSQGTEGEDVAQLQRLLADSGYYDGDDDGEFDHRLHWAVREWQADLGVERTGTVGDGTIVFLPGLPANAALSKDITVGATISPGTAAVELLPAAPDFKIELPEGQARLVGPGMSVAVAAADGTWEAVVTDIQLGENEIYTAQLAATEGDSICGDECGQIPLGDPTLLSSTIFTVPAIEGVTVPASAVTTGADGQAVVVTEAGETVEIAVLAGAEGTVVVEGIDAGLRVRVPGEATA